MSSGVKRDARAAEFPDEDEQGGKFQQVEGLKAILAEGEAILAQANKLARNSA